MRATLIAFVLCEMTEPAAIPAPGGPASGRSAAQSTHGSTPKPHLLGREPLVLEPSKGVLDLKAYAPKILLAEARFEVPSLLEDDLPELRDRILARIRARLAEVGGRDVERWGEEYSVFAITDFEGPPENLVDRDRLAALLKSERVPLDPAETEYTLSARFKYARHDLVVVDWDGAFVFDPEGDVEWAIRAKTSAVTTMRSSSPGSTWNS